MKLSIHADKATDGLQAEVDALKRLQAVTAGNEMLKSGKLKAEMESAIRDHLPMLTLETGSEAPPPI